MKKYFMSGTEDEVKFGDIIDLDLTKNDGKRTIHKRINCEFIPEMVPLFIEDGIITEVEDEDLVDFSDDEDEPTWDNSIAECLTDLINLNKQLIQKIADLQEEVKEVKKLVSKAHNGKKTAA